MNDMDALGGYGRMAEFGSGHFMAPHDMNQYGNSNEVAHNSRTCSRKRKISKGDNTSTNQAASGGGRGGRGGSSGGGDRGGSSSAGGRGGSSGGGQRGCTSGGGDGRGRSGGGRD